MKRIMRLGIAVLFISVILSGCHRDDKLKLKKEIKEINIYQSNEFKKESSDLIVSSSDIENTDIFETVKDIISDASKREGMVQMTEPKYDLEIIYENNTTKELYLWLMEVEHGIGSLMEVEDTHVVYHFSEELNAKLFDLIESTKD